MTSTLGELPLSIVIPTRNRRDLLQRAVDSVLQDACDGFEVVVSDNASDDGTPEALAAVRDPRLRVFRHTSNVGMRANWEQCIALARGRRLVMLSDDDYVRPGFASAILDQRAELDRVSLAFTGCRIVQDTRVSEPAEPGGGTRTRWEAQEFLLEVLQGRAHLQLCSVIFDRARLARRGFNATLQYALDMDAWIDQVDARGVLGIPSAVACYLLHPNNASNAIATTTRYREDALITRQLLDRLAGAAPHWSLQLLSARRNYEKAKYLAGSTGRRGIAKRVMAASLWLRGWRAP